MEKLVKVFTLKIICKIVLINQISLETQLFFNKIKL